MRWFFLVSLLLVGCAIQRRGTTEVGLEGGPKASLQTPTSPKQPSSTKVTKVIVRKYVPFAQQASQVGTQVNQVVEETITTSAPASVMVEESITENAKAEVSGSWFSEVKAKLESLKWLQWLGVLALALAAAMFYGPIRTVVGAGKSMQVAVAVAGLALIFGPVVVVGNEMFILLAAAAFVAWHYMTARMEYKSGQLDANKNGIPDNKE